MRHASVFRAVCLSIFIFIGCDSRNHSGLNDLSDAFRRPEYQGGSDGWGAARRRRLLVRYLEAKGARFTTMIEGRNALNPHDKYRRVHLVTGAGGQEGAAVKHLTYVLDTPGKMQNSDAQRECDRLLFQQLNAWAKTGTEPLHLAMEASCRQAPYGLTRQVREQM